jgi:hypothetical protein
LRVPIEIHAKNVPRIIRVIAADDTLFELNQDDCDEFIWSDAG